MKKQIYLSVAVCMLAFGLNAQDNPGKTKSAAKTFATEQEKKSAIAKLETKINADINDPTFPKEDLVKEKKELADMKQAKVSVSKTNK